MIRIASLRDLDAAVAEHCMGGKIHQWECAETSHWCNPCSGPCGRGCAAVGTRMCYSTSPAASYALEKEMRDFGWNWHMTEFRRVGDWTVDLNRADNTEFAHTGWHASRFVATCCATLAALGVELELVGEWDKQ